MRASAETSQSHEMAFDEKFKCMPGKEMSEEKARIAEDYHKSAASPQLRMINEEPVNLTFFAGEKREWPIDAGLLLLAKLSSVSGDRRVIDRHMTGSQPLEYLHRLERRAITVPLRDQVAKGIEHKLTYHLGLFPVAGVYPGQYVATDSELLRDLPERQALDILQIADLGHQLFFRRHDFSFLPADCRPGG